MLIIVWIAIENLLAVVANNGNCCAICSSTFLDSFSDLSIASFWFNELVSIEWNVYYTIISFVFIFFPSFQIQIHDIFIAIGKQLKQRDCWQWNIINKLWQMKLHSWKWQTSHHARLNWIDINWFPVYSWASKIFTHPFIQWWWFCLSCFSQDNPAFLR